MKSTLIACVLFLGIVFTNACHAADTNSIASPVRPTARPFQTISTNGHYHLRAGGSQSVIGLTNAPSTNPVKIAFDKWSDGGALFTITNGEQHKILLWNIRVQTKAKDGGTDGFGWNTVHDDYPGWTKSNSTHYPKNATDLFRVPVPGETPWRVCILYSTDWTDGGKTFSGDYEVISEEINE